MAGILNGHLWVHTGHVLSDPRTSVAALSLEEPAVAEPGLPGAHVSTRQVLEDDARLVPLRA